MIGSVPSISFDKVDLRINYVSGVCLSSHISVFLIREGVLEVLLSCVQA